MSVALAFAAVAAAAVAAGGSSTSSAMRRRKVRVLAGTGEPDDEGDEVEVAERRVTDQWMCKRGKNVVPNIRAIVPPQMLAASGPIGQAIVAGVDVVRGIFRALGVSKVCTVVGGRVVAVGVVRATPRRRIVVFITASIENQWAWWSFADERDTSGELPLQSHNHLDTPQSAYLADGGSPYPGWWPHTNIAKWQSSVEPEMELPAVEVVRTGDDLTVYAWLPPRAPWSTLNVWGKRTVKSPIIWQMRVEA